MTCRSLQVREILAVLGLCLSCCRGESITSRRQLNDALEAGPVRKVGFLSEANYLSVRTALSNFVEPVFFTHTEDLYTAVNNGTLVAGLISGVPNTHNFTAYSTEVVSPRSFQMMQGAAAQHLMEAVDAAVVRTHNAGELVKAVKSNPPFKATEVYTCSALDPSTVPFPNKSLATGLLKDVLDTKRLRVLAYGDPSNKPNWQQDGNYQVDPPTGFWPQYLDYFMDQFRAAYGSDIQLERVWTASGDTQLVLDGTVHMTEPYYLYEGLYNGSVKKWSHQFSCVVMGYEQIFFSKLAAPEVITLVDSWDKECPAALSSCVARRLQNQITSRAALNAMLDTGSNKKVGFLSLANYRSMATVLSSKLEPTVFASTADLYKAVTNGSVIAGMISGVPDARNFSVFGSERISPRAFQMMPGELSRHLRQAVDAAVVRTHYAAELLSVQDNNPPFEAIEVHTCAADDPAKVPFPPAGQATGLLKDVLDTKRLKVLASGSPGSLPNWDQDGNYQKFPPTGFWPDYMSAWIAHFKAAYGNDIVLERVWMTGDESTRMLLNGSVHMTEAYYVYESLWQQRPKKWSHDFSCVVMGYEQHFFARKAVLDFSAVGPSCGVQLAACENGLARISAAHGPGISETAALALLFTIVALLH